jgi:hypothetical protein
MQISHWITKVTVISLLNNSYYASKNKANILLFECEIQYTITLVAILAHVPHTTKHYPEQGDTRRLVLPMLAYQPLSVRDYLCGQVMFVVLVLKLLLFRFFLPM